MASPVVTPSATPSSTLAPSPSPTAAAVVPLGVNVTASFDLKKPGVSLLALGLAGVNLTFVAVELGNATVPLGDYEVSNRTETDTNGAELTSYVYKAAAADDSTEVAQGYTFHDRAATGQFEGIAFDIDPMSLKWTANLTALADPGAALGPFVLRYTISGTVASPDPLEGDVTVQLDTPQSDITTYVLPLTTTITANATTTTTKTVVAQVQLFDRAMVDGAWAAVTHSVVRTSAPGAARPVYVMELRLPAFTQSLHYDPSLNLGALLGASDRDGGIGSDGDGGDSMGLIIGVAVAIPLAVVFVVAAIAAVVTFTWHRKRRARKANLKRRSVINFHDL